jgi:C4-dicarboxylate-specific signal transduction histidine kinase
VKQLQLLDEVTEELNTIHVPDNETRQHLKKIATNLSEWIERAHATRALFSSLMEEENRVVRTRLKARPVVEQVSSQMAILLRSVKVDSSGIDDTLRFPKGSFAELSAIFQNVLINAANAMLDSKTKLIAVKSRTHGRSRSLLVQDTGTGVDLKSAEDLFRPFIRKSKISRERQQLGLGGAGLGLAIVKMIANNIHCKVAFVAPDANFRTAFQLSWNEAQ